MRLKIEKTWVKMVKFFGIDPPSDMSERGLQEWARPDAPHPSRRHRPRLLDYLSMAKNGTLHRALDDVLILGEEEISLNHVNEFHDLLALQPERKDDVHRVLVLDWVRSQSPTAEAQLQLIEEEELQPFVEHVCDYLRVDIQMHESAVDSWQRFQSERTRLDEVRKALEELSPADKVERLKILDEFTQTVLLPIVQAVEITEQTRSVYREHVMKSIADVVMRNIGINALSLSFPSFDRVEEVLNALPRFGDEERFKEYLSTSSVEHTEQQFEEFTSKVAERFGSKIEVNAGSIMDGIKKGNLNMQFNVNLGGEMKAVLFNPQNTFND